MVENGKSTIKNLVENGMGAIFALNINDYGGDYDIVQAQDVRPAAQMEAGTQR